jgi:hypothetical protein
MARGTITPTQATRAGTTVPAATTGDATNGHQVANDSRLLIIGKNTGATSRTITFLPSRLVDGLAVTSRVETLAAGESQAFSGFDVGDYGASLRIDVAHAEVTIQAIRV